MIRTRIISSRPIGIEIYDGIKSRESKMQTASDTFVIKTYISFHLIIAESKKKKNYLVRKFI